jgi:uncharacterized iron-regulated protein
MIMNPTRLWLSAGIACAAALSAIPAVAQHHPVVPRTTASACLQPATWAAPDDAAPRPLGANALLAGMARREVVLLGEQHDDDDHHRWQLQTLAALHAQRPDMVIGFETFPRRVQPVLDRWVAGELSVKDFLQQSEWDKVWNMPAELYLPLFQFARLNRIPIVALNVERSLTKAITERGWDAVPASQREDVGRPAPPSEAYRDYLFDIHRMHLAMDGGDETAARPSDSAFKFFLESQTTWDRAMAEALARRVTAAPGATRPLVVGVMGSGHIRHGHGVPHQLRDLGVTDIGTLLPVPLDFECQSIRAGLADAVFAVPQPALARPEPPRLGVRLEEHEGVVRIREVTPGSLAERSGLKNGDRLLEVAGIAPDKITPVVSQVRQQPHGTWLPMRIGRGEDTLELIVKFPPRP